MLVGTCVDARAREGEQGSEESKNASQTERAQKRRDGGREGETGEDP